MKASSRGDAISGPASVGIMAWTSRAMDDFRTLTIESTLCPCSRQCRSGQRVSRLAGLRDEQGGAARLQSALPVAHLGGDIDVDGDAPGARTIAATRPA